MELPITVITGTTNPALDLTREIEMVKAALLYGDRVVLMSPTAAMVQAALTLPDLPDPCDRDWPLPDLEPVFGRPFTANDIPGLVQELRSRVDVADLMHARDAGALEIWDMKSVTYRRPTSTELFMEAWRGNRQLGEDDPGAVDLSLMAQVSHEIGPSGSTYPMLGREVADVITRALKHPARLPGVRAAKEPALAFSMISRLAGFPGAKVDEILDVRRELANPLVRFRSAIVTMSNQLQATPIDASFAQEASALYRETAAPAMLEIEELTRERGYMHQLARQLKDGADAPNVKDAITLAAAAFMALPAIGLAAAGLVGTGAAATLDVATAVARGRDKLGREIRSNKFMFLAEVERQLKRT